MGPAVSFAKGVNGVEFSQEISGGVQKVRHARARLQLWAHYLLEQLLHAAVDVLGIAEPISGLSRSDGPVLSGPAVNILKQVMVDASVMRWREEARGQGFFRPQRGHFELECFECRCVFD